MCKYFGNAEVYDVIKNIFFIDKAYGNKFNYSNALINEFEQIIKESDLRPSIYSPSESLNEYFVYKHKGIISNLMHMGNRTFSFGLFEILCFYMPDETKWY